MAIVHIMFDYRVYLDGDVVTVLILLNNYMNNVS